MNFLNKVIVIIGPRATGKSTIVKNIIKSIDKEITTCKIIHGYHGYAGVPSFYSDFTAPENISSEYNEDEVMEICKKQWSKYKGDQNYEKALLVIDDLVFERGFFKSESMKFLFMNHRHANITLIITMQFPVGLSPEIRHNIDYTFVCKQNNDKDREKIWDKYACGFKDKKEYYKALNKDILLVFDKVSNPAKYFYSIIANNKIVPISILSELENNVP